MNREAKNWMKVVKREGKHHQIYLFLARDSTHKNQFHIACLVGSNPKIKMKIYTHKRRKGFVTN